MCSTPQKQPAATVALCAPSGMAAAEVAAPAPFSAVTPSLAVLVKGLVSRARKPGMLDVIAAAAARRARKVAVRVRRVTGLIWNPWRGCCCWGGGGGVDLFCDWEDSLADVLFSLLSLPILLLVEEKSTC